MTKIRLNGMQLVLLATAAQRDDGSLMPLPDRPGGTRPCVTSAPSTSKWKLV